MNSIKNRHVRVFISSTFRDMHEERDYLIKKTFPALRKKCKERGVEFTEIDLRWGVTEKQAESGEVLGICLKEIENSRPYFIGLLGERYGWVPPKENINPSLFETESWLKDQLEKSVTEMEIIHGVFNEKGMHNRAFFYFRDPSCLNKIEEKLRPDFTENNPDLENKLNKLKDKIRQSPLPLRENYQSAEELANFIFEDLWKLIDKDFPADSIPDPLDREIMEHEQVAESRRKVYIGRKEYFERLDQHANNQEPPLIIIGESGSGKTALIANWVEGYHQKNPEVFIIQHYCGSSAQSSDHIWIIKRIMQELKRRFNLSENIPEKGDALIKAFPNWLSMTAKKGKIILILDGLNQLENNKNALEMHWIPELFPLEIRLFISVLPGKAENAFRTRNWPLFKVHGLKKDERRELVINYLSRFTKSLDKQNLEFIIQKEQSNNPLYLKILLDEMRVFGVYEKLNDLIHHYLEAKTPKELYQKILERLEKDYDGDRKNLVKDALSLIWASRRGLTEIELQELLGEKDNPLPRAILSPVFLALEESFINRQGIVNFFHDYLKKAIYDQYIQSPEKEKKLHQTIAEYFYHSELNYRKVDELLWQYSKAEKWKEMSVAMQDLNFFNASWINNETAIKEYWVKIEHNTSITPKKTFQKIIENPKQYIGNILNLPFLLDHSGAKEEAFLLYGAQYEYHKERNSKEDNREMLNILNSQSAMYTEWGKLDKAMQLLKTAEQLCQQSDEQEVLMNVFNNQAINLRIRGQYKQALKLHKKEEIFYLEHNKKSDLSRCLSNQGTVMDESERSEEALKLYERSEKINRETGDKQGLQINLCNRSVIYIRQGKTEEAKALNSEIEKAFRELGDKKGLCIILGNQAVLLMDLGEPEKALELLNQQEQVALQNGNKDCLSGCYGNKALLAETGGDFDEALTMFKQQEILCRELGHKNNLCFCLGNYSSFLIRQNKPKEAMDLLIEQEQISRELENKDELSRSLTTQAIILHYGGELEKAYNYNKIAGEINRENGNKSGLLTTLTNQAMVLTDMGKTEEAMEILKQEEKLCLELNIQETLQINYKKQADILNNSEIFEEALLTYQKEENIAEILGNKEALVYSLGNQALVLYDLGRLAQALALLYKQELIAKEINMTLEEVFILLRGVINDETEAN